MGVHHKLILLAFFAFSACTSSSALDGPSPDSTPPPSSPAVTPDDSKQTISTFVSVPGDYNLTLSVDGVERSYILHIPAGYDGSKALPLVFVFHGGGGTAKDMVGLTGFSAKADQENFIVAYLNGTGEGRSWNNGIATNTTVDDVAFVRTLANQLKEELNVDGKRIYASGFSNGGMMSHRLGAELSDVLAGVAVVAGTIGNRQADGSFAIIPTPIGPIPVLMIHGKLDTSVLYDGGTDKVPELDVLPVSDAVAFWTEADGCTGSPEGHVSPNGNIVIEDYKNCAGGSEVKLVTIVNGRHQWPTLESQTGFSATDAIWDFFSRHSKPSAENTLPPITETKRVTALTIKDLPYATVSTAQKLDLYLPAGPTPTPVVVYVHGGGFKGGDKNSSMAQKIAAALMAKGFAVASINYRLSGEAQFPAAVRDVKTAVRWLRAHAGEYGLDPDKVGAWGDSAGGNLVSLLGTSCGDVHLEGGNLGNAGQSSCVQAVVDWYGPTDFLQMDSQYAGTTCPLFGHDAATSPESVYMDSPIQQIPNLVQKADPITFVTSDDPPFFIQHGTQDCTVPPLQSQIFYDALAPAIGPENVTLMYLEGAVHADPQFLSTSNLDLVVDFLDKRLKQN